MKELSKEIEKLTKGYSKYIYRYEDEIISDFCDKIREQKIGDLDLDTYSLYRFWKMETLESLKDFYKVFKKDTGNDDIPFDDFCEFIWLKMDDFMGDMPDNISLELFKGLNVKDGMAEA